MEKEKPFLFTDLVPPGEVYIPDESDSIPIRTWSRGDPFNIGFDLGVIAPNNKGHKKISVGGSQSTDGMLHYTAFENENNENEEEFVEEENQNTEEDGEYSADYDNEDDDGCIPHYGGVSYADIENEFDKYMMGDDEEGGNCDGNEEYDEEEENEEEYYDEEEGFEDEDDVGGEEEDQVNYEDEEEGENDAAEHNPVEMFEKVELTPREMDLIRSSGPAEEYSDLVEIMNEYNELVDCLASPRSHTKTKPTGNKGGTQRKPGAAKGPKQSRAPVALPVQRRLHAHSDSGSEEGEEDFMLEPHSDSDEDQQSASQHSLLARNKLNIVAGMVAGGPVGKKQSTGVRKKVDKGKPITGAKKPKKKLFGQALEDHKKMAMQMKLVSRSEVDEKQKAMLAAIVEARRKEEEALQREAERALAKRKKFKEALLEKAQRARQAAEDESSTPTADAHAHQSVAAKPAKTVVIKREPSGKVAIAAATGSTPSFLAPTKAYQVQCVPAKTVEQVVFTDEDLRRQEEEKREQVAAIRRKFKEQHKKILHALKKKNEEESKKAEEEQLREAQRKEKHRLKLQRMLTEKQTRTDSSPGLATQDDSRQNTDSPSSAAGSSGGHAPTVKLPRSATGAESESRKQQQSEGAAGSGLAAIRRRARSLSQSNATTEARPVEDSLLAQQRILRKQQEEEKAAIEAGLKDAMAKELRKLAHKEQQNKMTSYLNSIAEQRKREELDKQKKEERNKKRMAILSARLLNEAAERKLMQQQDTWRYASAVESAAPPIAASKAKSEPVPVVYKPRPPAVPAPSATVSTTTQAEESAAAKPQRKAKITPEMAERLANRLKGQSSRNAGEGENDKENTISSVPARDFADWKRKNGVPADGLVFAMTGWYPCVKEALLARGWYFNSDTTSPYFNLKWTLRSLEVSQETLQPWQLTNHYLKNVAITTKAGLIKSLQSLVWTADVEANDIIPRGYDLSNNQEMQAFLDDFRSQKAESVLKALYLQLTGLEAPQMERHLGPLPSPRGDPSSPLSTTADDCSTEASPTEPNSGDIQKASATADSDTRNVDKAPSLDAADMHSADAPDFPPVPALASGVALENILVNAAVFEAILAVLEKQIKPYEDSYIDDRDAHTEKMISDLEWELISQYRIDEAFSGLPGDAPEAVDAFLKEKEDQDAKPTPAQQREKRRLQRAEEEAREDASQRGRSMRALIMQDVERIHFILCSLMHHNKYQNGLNGKGKKSYNMWIVKPAAKSRGRGISTFMDLNKLLKYIDAGTGRISQWVVQKYMENPLIIANRKFDLRQWVVVTNWNPLTVWFYDECYARFSVEEYSTDVRDLENSYIHLVNNSIGKNSENFGKVIPAENGDTVEGYMWGFDQVADYMKFKSGTDMMRTKVHPRMKDIAKWSLMCASEMIEHRKNSWELYGFDFMVDDEYNAWLIEINSSPACDYSTTVTERYVQKALVELLSVVLDCREWEAQPKKNRGVAPETGGWEKIYQGPLLDMPVGAFGTDMSLKGEAYKNYPPRQQHNASAVNVQQVDFGTVRSNNQHQVPGLSTKLRASVTLQSAQHQASGESGPDSPVRKPRGAAAPMQKRPILASGKPVKQQSPASNDLDDEFNDSDDGEMKDRNAFDREQEKVSIKTKQYIFDEGSSKPAKSEVPTKAGKPAPGSGAPPVASIPIKVFSVDF